ncbi:MAG: hypothetical protein ACHRHE_16645 [Tepidisphaerales bacterium]
MKANAGCVPTDPPRRPVGFPIPTRLRTNLSSGQQKGRIKRAAIPLKKAVQKDYTMPEDTPTPNGKQAQNSKSQLIRQRIREARAKRERALLPPPLPPDEAALEQLKQRPRGVCGLVFAKEHGLVALLRNKAYAHGCHRIDCHACSREFYRRTLRRLEKFLGHWDVPRWFVTLFIVLDAAEITEDAVDDAARRLADACRAMAGDAATLGLAFKLEFAGFSSRQYGLRVPAVSVHIHVDIAVSDNDIHGLMERTVPTDLRKRADIKRATTLGTLEYMRKNPVIKMNWIKGRPTHALDPSIRQKLIPVLRTLHDQRRITICERLGIYDGNVGKSVLAGAGICCLLEKAERAAAGCLHRQLHVLNVKSLINRLNYVAKGRPLAEFIAPEDIGLVAHPLPQGKTHQQLSVQLAMLCPWLGIAYTRDAQEAYRAYVKAVKERAKRNNRTE